MIGTKPKIEDQTLVYDAVLSLCFQGNEMFWERTSTERRMFEKFKRGEISIGDSSDIPAPVFSILPG